MECRPRLLWSSWTWTVALILITSVILSTGQEGHEGKNGTDNSTVHTPQDNGSNDTKTVADVAADYEWNNTDDYHHHDDKGPLQEDEVQKLPGNASVPAETLPNDKDPIISNVTSATNASSSDNLTQFSNITTTSGANLSNETDHEQAKNEPNVDADSVEDSPAVVNDPEEDEVSYEMTDSSTDDDRETKVAYVVSSTSTGESSSIPPTTIQVVTTGSPRPIETQDAGDHFTNYTTPAFQDDEKVDVPSEPSKAWAVVIFSVLICFAVIFTLLFFVRRALIRKRKADQRKLLRGSISSEGYFFGDGEGTNVGKFEL